MQRVIGLIAALAILPLTLAAQDAESKPDYAAFSKLIHKRVAKELKEFKDDSGWGQTIPAPPKLPLPNLRTYLKSGNDVVLPHGSWQRFKGKVEDPDKNLKIVVKDFKKTADGKKYRLAADVDVTIVCAGEWQLWQKGLLIVSAASAADANFTAAVVCEVGVSFDIKKFPPELKVEPKVTDLGLNLVDFKFRHEPILKGEAGDNLRRDLKDLLRTLVKSKEGAVKDYANEAIAQSLKEGKGVMSASAILQTLPAPKEEPKEK
jgi:hypothetical protein